MTKIEDKSFYSDINLDKIESLLDSIKNSSLSDEEKMELIADVIYNAASNKTTMTFKQSEYLPTKPIGERKYYTTLIKMINNLVTKPAYDVIPFRYVLTNSGELRLESVGICRSLQEE